MKQVEGTSLLVTIAEDLSHEPILKVWALDKPVKKTGLPTCQSSLSIQNGRKQFPVSGISADVDRSLTHTRYLHLPQWMIFRNWLWDSEMVQ